MREDTTLGTTWQKRFKGWHHLPLYLQLCILPFSSNLNVSFVLTGAGARARGLISPSGGESELLSSLCISCAEAAAAVPAQLGMRVMQSKMMRTGRAAS